jgi:uncharacterized membrane protein
MVSLPRIRLATLDVSSRTGTFLGAFANGLSFQPNLLSRDSRDQAVVSGIAAASAFGWGSASHSFLRSVANRLPGARATRLGRLVSGASVDVAAALGGFAVARALPARDGEPAPRAVLRLASAATAATASAGLVADVLEPGRGRPGNRMLSTLVTLTSWSAGHALSRRGIGGTVARAGEGIREEMVREVDLPKATAAGVGVTAALLGFAWLESRLSDVAAGGAAAALGGESDDHRTLGRAVVWALVGTGGWWALTRVNARLTLALDGVEAAHATPPVAPEITAGPGSTIPWSAQSRESRRWLTMALSPDAIEEVMGEQAMQPIRLYSALGAAATTEARAELLLAEIDRTGALHRPVFVLFSPTGSGYVSYVGTETIEYLTRGRCASAAIQYSVLPSALSLTRVGYGADQMRIVYNGIVARLLAMPARERPRFFLVGESLGADVSQEPFSGQGIGAVDGLGLDAALWLGTPASSEWREQLWGTRPLGRAPEVGPGEAFLPRSIGDWVDLDHDRKGRVRYLFLQNGNDPIPKMNVPLLWRRPAWLGRDDERPPGAPRRTWWLPVTTFFTTFVDVQNSLHVIPGTFGEGGHDYRRVIPGVIRELFRLDASDQQMASVEAALRRRELVWNIRRRWLDAQAAPPQRRTDALARVVADVASWTGQEATEASVQALAHALV